MIPQGFRNIKIENDFSELFGISEWLPVSIEAGTLPGQPGRSQAIMNFTHAGITSDTRLDDPEEINQEYVRGSANIYRQIWKKFEQYFGKKVFYGREQTYLVEKYKPYDKRSEAFINLLNEAIDNYNEVIKKIVGKIFSGKRFRHNRKKN
jgi:hypothetical protein